MQTDTIGAQAKVERLRLKVMESLSKSDAFTISVVGAPGCGKTTLIDATIERLRPEVQVGVIACDPASHRNADRISRHSQQVLHVNTGEAGALDLNDVCGALNALDLNSIDLLFIENVVSLDDIGVDATVVIFSVAAGDDKAEKHPGLVRAADVVLLNKVDLLGRVKFNLASFRSDVKRINDRAELIEVSGLDARDIELWLEWLRGRLNSTRRQVAQWFG